MPEILVRATRLTGGSDALRATRQQLWSVGWSDPPAPRGFHLYDAVVAGERVPCLSRADTFELPALRKYAELRERSRSISTAEAALAINPGDADALRGGAAHYASAGDWKRAAELLSALADVDKNNGAVEAQLGDALFRSGQFPEAERALLSAVRNNGGSWLVEEELGRICLERRDFDSALRHLGASLKAKPDNQAVWFLRARTALHAGDWRDASESWEHGIALGGDNLAERMELVRQSLAHNERDRALRHVRAVAQALPNDASVRRTYAEFLDRLDVPEEALSAWSKVLESQPRDAEAHVRRTEILLSLGRTSDALQSTEDGLAVLRDSARLHLAHANVLYAVGEQRKARHVITSAAARIVNPDLLRSDAEVRDRAGYHAPEAYERWVDWLVKNKPGSTDYLAALRRGIVVALRDNDTARARLFHERLLAAGDKSFARTLSAWDTGGDASSITVPGGLDAIAYVAGGREKTPGNRFLLEFSRIAIAQSKAGPEVFGLWTGRVRSHFARVAALTAFGKGDDGVKVTLATGDSNARRTGQVLELLGWKLRASKGTLAVEPVVKGEKAQRQETAAAIAIDENEMKRSLEQGKPYTFEIPRGSADIFPPEAEWRAAFYPKENSPGGFVEVLASNPTMAYLYAGLNSMNRDAARALIAGHGLKMLAPISEVLFRYGSALAVSSGRVIVPGREKADAVWSDLVGAAPGSPGAFLRALVTKDNGRLLGYYHTVAKLASARQAFFTASVQRTRRFYELYTGVPEQRYVGHENPLADFMRALPLDERGKVRFPGSPEVWMVVKGQSNSAVTTAKLVKRVARTAAPEQEDEILIRLVKTRYEESDNNRSQLDNFLAVLRIDLSRERPLDGAEAILLTQQFARFEAFYPYFSVFTSLNLKDFQGFFAFAEKAGSLPDVDAHHVLGQFQSLVHIAALLTQARILSGAAASEYFRRICAAYLQATDRQSYARVAFRAAADLAEISGAPKDRSGALIDALAPTGSRCTFEYDGRTRTVNYGENRRKNMLRVLEMQQVPSIDLLFRIDALLASIKDRSSLESLEAALAGVQTVELPRAVILNGHMQDVMQTYRISRLTERVHELRQQLSKRKIDPRAVERVTKQIREDLFPQLTIGLTGIVYCFYLDPADLILEDTLLVRKHQFLDKTIASRQNVFVAAEFRSKSEGSGSYFLGNFAGFASAVGWAVAPGVDGASGPNRPIAATQIGAIRASDWRLLTDRDLEHFGLTVRAAREWIVESTRSADLHAALVERTAGLLPLARRSTLMEELAARRWKAVWDSITLSELYFLGLQLRSMPAIKDWESPVLRGLKQSTPAQGNLDALGSVPFATLGVWRPMLIELPSYEEAGKYLHPTRLSERTAEAKLYWAYFADRAGIPAAAVAEFAEPVTRVLLRRMQLSDSKDWRSALDAWASIDNAVLASVVAPQ
jgi:tetratricopeptide (TPR) repeat protein